MQIYQNIKLASRIVWRYPLRSSLMMIGMIIGISSLTVISSVGESTKKEMMSRFKRMVGPVDLLIITPGDGRQRGMVSLSNIEPSIKFADVDAIANELSGIKQIAPMQNQFDIDLSYRDRRLSVGIFGVPAIWFNLRDEALCSGDYFSREEVQSQARVAVIGSDVKTALFPEESPLGKTFRIGDVPFQVKGVLTSRGLSPGGKSLDKVVYIPITTSSRRLFNRDALSMVFAQLRDPQQSETMVEKVRALLRERHHLASSAPDDFTVVSSRVSMERIAQMGSTLSRVLVIVAIVAMIIAGVVITSLMLLAISERRKEIGVRRSMGACRQDIMLQFILEALTISTIGGLLGIGFGFGGTNLVIKMQQLPVFFAWKALLAAIIISILIGLLFGSYPAWRAAKIDAIKALRS